MAMRIYTRGGDKGHTSLFDGSRVPKDHPRIECYGTVDELGSILSLARLELEGEAADQVLAIQRLLFDLGASLATPGGGDKGVTADDVARLEAWIDGWWGRMPELKAFILPGGCEAAARLHLARTVCRRAERCAVELGNEAPAEAVRFLNRLSDHLFALARWTDHEAGTEEPARKAD